MAAPEILLTEEQRVGFAGATPCITRQTQIIIISRERHHD